MFQRIHLSAFLPLAAQCVKGELSISTGISRLASISTPPAGEAHSASACVFTCEHLFMHVCACLNTFLLEGWVPSLLVYISPLRSSMCSLKRLKKTENFLLPADMIHPVGLL